MDRIHAKVSVGSGSAVIVMFLHLAIHVHTARVLLFTVKLGAVGGTSILTGAMVAFLTSLVSRKPSNVTKVICLAFLHISEFTVGTGLFTIFQPVVSALADVAIVILSIITSHPVQYISPSGALQSFGGIQLALFCDFTRLPTLFLVLPGEESRTSLSS